VELGAEQKRLVTLCKKRQKRSARLGDGIQPDFWYSDPRLKSIGSFGRAPECQRSDEEFQ
jgi:hypothetical protein